MVNTVPILVACLVVGVPLLLYVAFLGLSVNPFFQRHFLYAHKIHTLWWGDINEPEQWGFAKNQVTPFHLTTADNETLYAWHVLPLSLYAQRESKLASQPTGLSADITATENFRLLRDDPTSKLIISFHGNAAQLTQGLRPLHYHSLTSLHSPYHLLAIDYRGFGLSSGRPSERGLTLDAQAALRWAVRTAGVPRSRIVLVGHSLGTAVVSALLHEELVGKDESDVLDGMLETEAGMEAGVEEDFAGVVLVAGFSSLPEMLSGYAIAGWVPVLWPVKWWPWLGRVVMERVVDKWDSAGRWREIVQAVKRRGGRLRLSLVHARNDWDIPCHEDDKLFRAAVEGLVGDREVDVFETEKERRTVVRGKDSFVTTWQEEEVVIRQERFPHGGHNPILTYAPVLLAVLRSFGLGDEATS